VLGQLFEAYAKHQFGAAPRPAAFALDLLQPLEQPAHIEHHAGAIGRKDLMEVRHRPPGVGGHIRNIAGPTPPAPANAWRCVVAGYLWQELRPINEPRNALARLNVMSLEKRQLWIGVEEGL